MSRLVPLEKASIILLFKEAFKFSNELVFLIIDNLWPKTIYN